MLTEIQKANIKSLCNTFGEYGSYELARMIVNHEFYVDWGTRDITASYYSVLNVIRRFRKSQAANLVPDYA